MHHTIDQVGPRSRFFPDLSGSDADRMKNRMKNQKTSIELGYDEPNRRTMDVNRSPTRYNQHYNSQLLGNLQVKDGQPGDLSGTAILNRSRSKSRSVSNKRLHCECEEPAGKKTKFRRMIE